MDCAKGLTVECSMCGDVGFPEKLQQCKACVRVQHMYVFSTSGGHLCVISHGDLASFTVVFETLLALHDHFAGRLLSPMSFFVFSF